MSIVARYCIKKVGRDEYVFDYSTKRHHNYVVWCTKAEEAYTFHHEDVANDIAQMITIQSNIATIVINLLSQSKNNSYDDYDRAMGIL